MTNPTDQSEDRLRRPELDRREPVRSMAGGVYDPRYGSPSTSSSERGFEGRGFEGRGFEGGGSDDGAADRCVEAGYAVADENVRDQYRYDKGSGSGASSAWGATDFQSLSGQMMAAASDLGQLWFQLIESIMASVADFGAAGMRSGGPFPGGPFPGAVFPGSGLPGAGFPGSAFAGSPPARGGGAAAGGWRPDGVASDRYPGMADLGEAEPWLSDQIAIRVKVLSERGAELSVQLHPGARGRPMSSGALHPVEEGPSLTGLQVNDSESDELSLELVVPSEQAPGLYHGVLFDPTTGVPRGTVTVRLD